VLGFARQGRDLLLASFLLGNIPRNLQRADNLAFRIPDRGNYHGAADCFAGRENPYSRSAPAFQNSIGPSNRHTNIGSYDNVSSLAKRSARPETA
jgi:hypothetical protein